MMLLGRSTNPTLPDSAGLGPDAERIVLARKSVAILCWPHYVTIAIHDRGRGVPDIRCNACVGDAIRTGTLAKDQLRRW
jgi:hypothetical protein